MKDIPLCFCKSARKKTAAEHNFICAVGLSHRGVILGPVFLNCTNLEDGSYNLFRNVGN